MKPVRVGKKGTGKAVVFALFTGLGALLFGTFYGFLYNELGASRALFIGSFFIPRLIRKIKSEGAF